MLFKNRYKVVIIVAVIVSFFGYGFLESYWLKTTRLDFVDSDIPDAFVGKKIVFLSDLHLGFYFSDQRVKKLVAKINQLQPDIIIFGGDLIDRSAKYAPPRFNGLKDLQAVMGKFAVLGNHDNMIDNVFIKGEMKKAGIIDLDNQAEWLWATSTGSAQATSTPSTSSGQAATSVLERIKIGGVGDLWTSTQDPTPTLAGVSEKDFVILVAHDPDFITKFDNNDIDLMLSGHTHAGQITFFGLWGVAPKRSYHGQKLRYGLVDMIKTKIYVTSGVGATILPLRFFARPEIAVITLKKP